MTSAYYDYVCLSAVLRSCVAVSRLRDTVSVLSHYPYDPHLSLISSAAILFPVFHLRAMADTLRESWIYSVSDILG